MSILGMGTLEVLVVLLVAFIVVGPERMVDAARLLGKAAKEGRRLTEGLSNLMVEEERPEPVERPKSKRGAGAGTMGPQTRMGPAHVPGGEGVVDGDQGPVAFEPSGVPNPQDESERPLQGDET
jgi:Sec-independent protein translocase protein TatA